MVWSKNELTDSLEKLLLSLFSWIFLFVNYSPSSTILTITDTGAAHKKFILIWKSGSNLHQTTRMCNDLHVYVRGGYVDTEIGDDYVLKKELR